MALKSNSKNTLAASVVIPFYNGGCYLKRLFSSLEMQECPPAEVIFVDDCSEKDELDNLWQSAEIWTKENNIPVIIVVLPENRGVAYARNRGWDVCRYQLVAFLDCDDAWHPEKLCRVVNCFEQESGLSLLGHRVLKITEENAPSSRIVGEIVCRLIEPRRWLYRNHFVTCSSVVVRADGDFRFDCARRRSEDYALWTKYAFNGCCVGIIDEPLGYYFKQPFGFSGLSQDLWAMEKAELDVLKWVFLNGHIGLLSFVFFSFFSMIKFIRRKLTVRPK